MTKRFRKSDITTHYSQDYSGPAINVKVYQFPRDAHPAQARVMAEFGCNRSTADQALEFAYETAQRTFWADVQDVVQEIFGPKAQAFSMGRSGGWLYVGGINADAEAWALLKEWQTWDARMVAKWGRLVAWCQEAITHLTSWDFAKEEIQEYIERATEEADAERVRDAAPALLDALLDLENCPDLNLEELDEVTLSALEKARAAIALATGKEVAV